MEERECATAKGVKEAFERMEWMREPLSEEESNTATELGKGSRVRGGDAGVLRPRETGLRPGARNSPGTQDPRRLRNGTLQARM